MSSKHPYHPIIYVRGFAATSTEIEDAVSDPYMGFNLGSTKARTAWTGDIKRFYFESPVVRLGSDYGYEDVIFKGDDIVTSPNSDEPVPYQCIVIHRYYEEASESFSDGKSKPIELFARRLSELIHQLRERVCANRKNGVSPDEFRVYLVAHSMGGLICRAFLQNAKLDPMGVSGTVDKLFTYASPHNGIDVRLVGNVPGWSVFGDVTNFSRERMAGYLGLPRKAADVSEVVNFPPERIFNLVGTNSRDYRVLGGLSSWAAGDESDGLVRIENATTFGVNAAGETVSSPRAFVHRSHSGHYGIVNSEEGYQNLVRFFFGQIRIDGMLDVDDISLPLVVEKEFKAGKEVRASYEFAVVVSVRGCQWQMHRRTRSENSTIFRTYDELFPGKPGTKRKPDRTRSPHLFSTFLDPELSMAKSGSVSFAFDLSVFVPDYEVDGRLFLDQHYEGGTLFRETVLVEAIPDEKALGGWRIKWGLNSETPGVASQPVETTALPKGDTGLTFSIPIRQERRPGLVGALRIEARPWNQPA
jgi:pimeloyl-ACP methyl ester carboxylesterase